MEDARARGLSQATHWVLTVESLNTEDEKKIVQLLKRCHENLGHPGQARFISMLKAARANEKCIKLAKGLTCSTCDAMRNQKSPNVARAVKDLEFNELVCVDTFEVELGWRKLKMLNLVDMATRYQLCIPLWKGFEI